MTRSDRAVLLRFGAGFLLGVGIALLALFAWRVM